MEIRVWEKMRNMYRERPSSVVSLRDLKEKMEGKQKRGGKSVKIGERTYKKKVKNQKENSIRTILSQSFMAKKLKNRGTWGSVGGEPVPLENTWREKGEVGRQKF